MIYPPQPSQISTRSRQFRKLEEDHSWIAEPCVRGLRCLAHRHHCRIDLWTWKSKQISAPLVEIRRQIMTMIPDETILDGVLFGTGKLYDQYFVFDIPQFKNAERGVLSERHNLLSSLKPQPNIIITDHQPDKNKLVFYHEVSKISLYKGIIIKDLSSMYPNVTKSRSFTNSWLEVNS